VRGNSHAQFLEGRTGAIPFGYSIRDCGHVHLVKLGGFAQNVRGITARSREQNDRFDHGAAQCALVGMAKKGREQLTDGVVIFGLLEAVLLGENRGAVLVQQVDHALGNKQEVAFHQPHRDSRANRRENAKAGCIGDGFHPAPLILFGFECSIVRPIAVHLLRVMDGAIGIFAYLMDCADVAAFGDNGVGGKLAHLELGSLSLVVGLWLIVADGDVLVAWQYGTAFLLRSVGGADLHKVRFCGNGLCNVRRNLRFVAF
jgi:hypothetical protein